MIALGAALVHNLLVPLGHERDDAPGVLAAGAAVALGRAGGGAQRVKADDEVDL